MVAEERAIFTSSCSPFLRSNATSILCPFSVVASGRAVMRVMGRLNCIWKYTSCSTHTLLRTWPVRHVGLSQFTSQAFTCE